MAKISAFYLIFACLILIDAACGWSKVLGGIATDKRSSMPFGNPGGNDGVLKTCSIEVKEVRNEKK